MTMKIRKNCIEIVADNRVFECYYTPEYSGSMCAVSICEVVRPNWKIFRTTYCTYKTFWVNDYHSIKGGISRMVRCFIQEEEEKAKRWQKWEEMENG